MNTHFARIGLIGKEGSPRVCVTLRRLVDYLRSQGIGIVAEREICRILGDHGVEARTLPELGADIDLAIVMGGDGTMLKAARTLAAYEVPLLGINLGRLGFLTDILPDQAVDELAAVLSGQYIADHRFLLETRLERGGKTLGDGLALNDVVVQKANGSRLMELETHIDQSFVCAHQADGLIVATPTGSTAYALSGGGPILHPALSAMVVVPICPHTLSDRPVVVQGTSIIHINVQSTGGAAAQVAWDGQQVARV
jgi:NAD+ kinase